MCTDFILKCDDGAHIVGRSMEFSRELPTKIQMNPPGQTIQSGAPNGKRGKAWTSKYGYAAAVCFEDAFTDGLNEKGLSVGALWFPDVEYPDVSSAPPEEVIDFMHIGPWLLGNFETVHEATGALRNVYIYTHQISEFDAVPPIHLSLHDAMGNSAVVEFLDGKLEVFDNQVGVVTNAPEFPWHVANLRNYLNLSADDAASLSLDGTCLIPTGEGTGLCGLPGDWTPPSRFVRAALVKQFIVPPKSAKAGVIAAIHLLNMVDIPYGAIRNPETGQYEYTQWIIVKNLSNGDLHLRTYHDQNIHTISLAKQDLKPGDKPYFLPLHPGC